MSSSTESVPESDWARDVTRSFQSPASTFHTASETPGLEDTPDSESESMHRGSLAESWSSHVAEREAASSSSGVSSVVISSVMSSISSAISSVSEEISSGAEEVVSSVSSAISSGASPSILTPTPTTTMSIPTPTSLPNTTSTSTSSPDTTTTTTIAPPLPPNLWHASQTALAHTTPYLWATLLLSAPLALYIAWAITHFRTFTAYMASRRNAALARQTLPSMWNTQNHTVLSSLILLWLRGIVPGDGMWNRTNAYALRSKPDKSALEALVRMGMYPLFIQDGGLTTTEVEKGGLTPWGSWTFSVWKQSSKRAVFEFAVPRARGWAVAEENITDAREKERRREDDRYMQFVFHLFSNKHLRQAARWRVAISGQEWEGGALRPTAVRSKAGPDEDVPWEMGATSRIRAFLPFKWDRVLRVGEKVTNLWGVVANWLVGTRLLTRIHVPVVRIEAPDDEYIELDKEILLIAQEAGLDADWDQTFANFELRKAYRRVELDPAEFLPADFLTID